MIEVVKVTKPIVGGKSAPRWVIRDINDSRVERREEVDVPKSVRNQMVSVTSMFFEAERSQRGWVISSRPAEGW